MRPALAAQRQNVSVDVLAGVTADQLSSEVSLFDDVAILVPHLFIFHLFNSGCFYYTPSHSFLFTHIARYSWMLHYLFLLIIEHLLTILISGPLLFHTARIGKLGGDL